eukprot:759717-Hanusia_phi.AAC.8
MGRVGMRQESGKQEGRGQAVRGARREYAADLIGIKETEESPEHARQCMTVTLIIESLRHNGKMGRENDRKMRFEVTKCKNNMKPSEFDRKKLLLCKKQTLLKDTLRRQAIVYYETAGQRPLFIFFGNQSQTRRKRRMAIAGILLRRVCETMRINCNASTEDMYDLAVVSPLIDIGGKEIFASRSSMPVYKDSSIQTDNFLRALSSSSYNSLSCTNTEGYDSDTSVFLKNRGFSKRLQDKNIEIERLHEKMDELTRCNSRLRERLALDGQFEELMCFGGHGDFRSFGMLRVYENMALSVLSVKPNFQEAVCKDAYTMLFSWCYKSWLTQDLARNIAGGIRILSRDKELKNDLLDCGALEAMIQIIKFFQRTKAHAALEHALASISNFCIKNSTARQVLVRTEGVRMLIEYVDATYPPSIIEKACSALAHMSCGIGLKEEVAQQGGIEAAVAVCSNPVADIRKYRSDSNCLRMYRCGGAEAALSNVASNEFCRAELKRKYGWTRERNFDRNTLLASPNASASSPLNKRISLTPRLRSIPVNSHAGGVTLETCLGWI